jgi:hypothetical protein
MSDWGNRLSIVTFALALAACTKSDPKRAPDMPRGSSTMKIESEAFSHQAEIPKKHTCEGQDVSPPLSWSGVPTGAKSLALVVDDPDAPDPAAPKRVWVHWVLFDIPPPTSSLPEAAGAQPGGAKDGKNDWGKTGWGGPCPPIGRHRYFFKLYALDALLALDAPTKAELEKAMAGHILAQSELVGTYKKTNK